MHSLCQYIHYPTTEWFKVLFSINSTVRATVFGRHQFFGTSEHYRKAHGSLLSGWMNYNYIACCWFPTSSNISILPSQFWQIRFESCWLHCSKCRILVLLRYRKHQDVRMKFTVFTAIQSCFIMKVTICLECFIPEHRYYNYTLLKSNVTTWSVGGRCHGSQECGSRNVNFIGDGMQSSALRITLKSTTLVHVRSRFAWTRKPWQRS